MGTQTFFAHVKSWGEVEQLIQADIVSCFENLDHLGLLSVFHQYIDDQPFCSLVHSFLKTQRETKKEKATQPSIKEYHKAARYHQSSFISFCTSLIFKFIIIDVT